MIDAAAAAAVADGISGPNRTVCTLAEPNRRPCSSPLSC